MNDIKLKKIVDALQRVPNETNKSILDMATSFNENEIIQLFNQKAYDLFDNLLMITNSINPNNDYKISSYRYLLDTAIKTNAKVPIDQFALAVLDIAPEIYDENEEFILNMQIKDLQVEKQTNEFDIIKSDKFKNIWRKLSSDNRKILKDIIMMLTVYSHAYFYKKMQLIK